MSIRDSLWGTGKKVTQEEVIELTNQFYVTLRAYFTQIKKEDESNIRNKEAFNRIKALLELAEGEKGVQSWTNAYEIEQLLVHLFDDDTVATELAVRLLEARSVLRLELAALYEAHLRELENPSAGGQNASAATVSVQKRRLLARLVNDLQWRYIVNEATRRYSKLITRRTATLSVSALILFVGAIVMIATGQFYYGDLNLLWVAGLAGMWGATFSMLATVKSRLADSKFDDLKSMKAGSVLLSRAAIGAGAACILFFFLLSGLLAGSAFPSLARPREGTLVAGTPASTGTLTTSTAPSSPPSTGTSTTQPAPSSTPTTGMSTTPSAPGSTASTGASTTPPSAGSTTSTGSSTTPTAPGAKPEQAISTPGSPAPAQVGSKPQGTPESSGSSATTRPASGQEKVPVASVDLALLIVWCFIAGFSEQLIPGLLVTTEARAGSPAPSTTDRFRPTTGTTQVAPPPAPQTATPPTSAPAPQSGAAAGKPEQERKT